MPCWQEPRNHLVPDPADYSAPGVQPYPKGWNLPGTAAQRGNVKSDGAGDPLTQVIQLKVIDEPVMAHSFLQKNITCP